LLQPFRIILLCNRDRFIRPDCSAQGKYHLGESRQKIPMLDVIFLFGCTPWISFSAPPCFFLFRPQNSSRATTCHVPQHQYGVDPSRLRASKNLLSINQQKPSRHNLSLAATVIPPRRATHRCTYPCAAAHPSLPHTPLPSPNNVHLLHDRAPTHRVCHPPHNGRLHPGFPLRDADPAHVPQFPAAVSRRVLRWVSLASRRPWVSGADGGSEWHGGWGGEYLRDWE
jgi:hypothetical protein